ncbi:2-oxoglutarate and iron-dependent oxygenase JMJD4-like [Watersipora subatra]|uniref:2-oxoglutarate and iron-dependent oxygenase JMJD4-like n=1 Tax=Watersipora subatra TaxID=2589382 RepID=UPI00355B9FBC
MLCEISLVIHYSTMHQEQVKENDCTASLEVCNEITRVHIDANQTNHSVALDYISKNIPFILTGDVCITRGGSRWPIFDLWLQDEPNEGTGYLNVDYICQKYGDETVPVARCGREEYGAHPKTEMTFREYLNYLTSFNNSSHTDCLYLKDYHFMRSHPDVELYETPACFSSDWLNEYCCDKGIDDYRFVYMGPKGSWTPFHADVLRSYSWSANVCGKKRWILYPSGGEDKLKDKLGNLPFDVSTEQYASVAHHLYKQRMEVVQEAGEAIFIPSGWHHQVHNLEVTLSVNHNWFNRNNVPKCWQYLQETLSCVQRQIDDCRDMHDWHGHCQVLLRAYLGFNYGDFLKIIIHIAKKRILTNEDANYDVQPILAILQSVCKDEIALQVSQVEVNDCLAHLYKHLPDNKK